ncbi:hypothetical protein V2J09_001883 [Rumex salicifolius]
MLPSSLFFSLLPSSSSISAFADLPHTSLSRAPTLIPALVCSSHRNQAFAFFSLPLAGLESSVSYYVMELKNIKDAFDHSANATSSQCDHRAMLAELETKLKGIAPLSQVEGTQKDLNVALSKYAKQLDKFFHTDISKAYRNVDFDSQTVNQIIAGHLYRQGLFEVGDCFKDEAEEQEAAALKSPFTEMYHILEAIKSRNLEPALNWVVKNREQLRGSELELQLHSLQYLEVLQKKGYKDALNYARTFFPPFSRSHTVEFHKLMACLAYARKLESSPYSELLSANNWDKVAEELTRHFCDLLGQSFESPLSVTVAAGVQGLPTLLKLMNVNVMTGKKQEWQTMKQLPVPLDLGREFQFHSIFVCPVSRDQATEENPPMLMNCGHVLCKQSIMKLSKSSTKSFKCPYCPFEIDASQCKQLYF